MKLSEETRKKLQEILGFKYDDDDYQEADLKEIVDVLIEAVEDKKDVIESMEMDMAENYKYVGGTDYDDY